MPSKKRRAFSRRLRVGNIEHRRYIGALPQYFYHLIFSYYNTPRGVYKRRVRLHHPEMLTGYHTFCFIKHRRMKGYNITLTENIFQRTHLDIHRSGLLNSDIGVVGDYLHLGDRLNIAAHLPAYHTQRYNP